MKLMRIIMIINILLFIGCIAYVWYNEYSLLIKLLVTGFLGVSIYWLLQNNK